jgi:uncharacterized membrane protein YgcG
MDAQKIAAVLGTVAVVSLGIGGITHVSGDTPDLEPVEVEVPSDAPESDDAERPKRVEKPAPTLKREPPRERRSGGDNPDTDGDGAEGEPAEEEAERPADSEGSDNEVSSPGSSGDSGDGGNDRSSGGGGDNDGDREGGGEGDGGD